MSGVLSKEDSAVRPLKRRALRKEDFIEISEDEAQNFLKILSVLLLNKENESENEETTDNVDGIGDVVIFTATRISELLLCDIDSLKLPKILKKSLKILKALTDFLKAKDTLCLGERDFQGQLQLILQQLIMFY